MDLMDIRRTMMGVIAGMAGGKIIGIKYTSFIVDTVANPNWYTLTAQIPMDEKPAGFMIACESEIGAEYVNMTTIRFAAMFSEYNGGVYRPTSIVTANKNGAQDFYNLQTASYPTYDETNKILTVKSSGGYFTADRTYHVWYFTLPF